MKVVLLRNPGKGVQGGYDSSRKQIILNLNAELNNEQTKRLLIHEAQNVIQNIEGLARGSSFQSMLQRVLKERSLTIQQNKSLSAKERDLIEQEAYKSFGG
jgi:hypothetical protein